MTKKIDINKILSTGSAKQRAVLLFYNFNLIEAIEKGLESDEKPPLTNKEATDLFNSFKSSKDILIYNNYRELNIQIIRSMRWLISLSQTFEISYWKNLAMYWSLKCARFDINVRYKSQEVFEDLIIHKYTEALEYYTALKIYIKESGYKDKFIIGVVNNIYQSLKDNWEYQTINGDKEMTINLSNVEPDTENIKHILKVEFKLEYETE
jgi:hypothetical protein